MTDLPLISVIMASYNHADFIGQAIDSLQQQSYENWELLIADDASTDSTLDILKSYENDKRIRVFSFTINRQHHMRNFAADHARGEYIAFLNSDDLFMPEKLSQQAQYLINNRQSAAVFTHVHCIDKNSQRLANHSLEKTFAVENHLRHEWLRDFSKTGNCLCISSALVRRRCFEEIGRFDPLLIQMADFDLWIKICLKWEIHVIPEPLTAMRILPGDKNLSSQNPTANSRIALESHHIYNHYFSNEAISQATDIFPEIIKLLPEDTLGWQLYLLCQTFITTSLQRELKRISFLNLHKLLTDPEAKSALLQRCPRLLKNMFLWEGLSLLHTKQPYLPWVVLALDTNGTVCCEQSYRLGHKSLKHGTICLPFPVNQRSKQLCITLSRKSPHFACKRFRMYDPQTGQCLFDSESINAATGKKYRIKPSFVRQTECGVSFYLPEIDFCSIQSKWIDIEIDCAHVPFISFYYSLKKKLCRITRKFTFKKI